MRIKKFSAIEIFLSVVSACLLLSIFLKAIFDLSPDYDVGWYHHPFAARIWGIIPSELFTSGDKIEYRYDGFPLLAHFFQGMLWKLTGQIETTNLVGYLSIIVYLIFLRQQFKIPLYISAIAIYTIPAVITHATVSFVDLLGNIGASMALMMTYNFFRQSRLPDKQEILFAFLGAAVAVNTKPQLQPLIFVLWFVVLLRLLWLYLQDRNTGKIYSQVLATVLASMLIFATPIKNTVLYGNPLYPIKIQVAGIVLNHEMTPETYEEGNRREKWIRSVFEVDTPKWTPAQWNYNDNRYFDRAGGFFAAYVVFNLLLLLACVCSETIRNLKLLPNKRKRSGITALCIMLALSLYTANFPQSHELRYLMTWMITLVSLNLHLVFSERVLFSSKRISIIRNFQLVYLIFFLVMCIKIESKYLMPQFEGISSYLDVISNQEEILSQISPNQRNCVVSYYLSTVPINSVFYLSSYFHPDLKIEYGIEVAPDIDSCQSTNIINP